MPLGATSVSLHLSIFQRYHYHQVWDHQVTTVLTTLILRSVQHILQPFYLSNTQICHTVQCMAWEYLCMAAGIHQALLPVYAACLGGEC